MSQPKPRKGVEADPTSKDETGPWRSDDVVRVSVLKFGFHRARTGAHPKSDYTTVYVRQPRWDRLLTLAGGIERVVTEACRAAAGRVSAAHVTRAGSYSAAVLVEAERNLRVTNDRVLSAQMKLATENNSAWK